MLDSIPGLMNAIRMINSYSRYYNTSERMTALFLKVTNQMITACRAHITDSGYSKLWDLERDVALERLGDCQNLNNEYQLCFQRTKEKLKGHPEERPFDFSEMYIFGKFNNLCRRCVAFTHIYNNQCLPVAVFTTINPSPYISLLLCASGPPPTAFTPNTGLTTSQRF